jgi:16S rRNA (guanine1207-N2)-methyltransferase
LGFAVDMCDVNLKAIELSKQAINEQKLNAEVYESDAYLNVNNKYDYIISNPPIRVGKQKLYEIVMKARDYLQDEGEVWLVVRKDKGAESLVRDMKKVYSIVETVEKKKGFHIIKACK